MDRLEAVSLELGFQMPRLCTPKQQDPIVEEVCRIREEHAATFNYDIDAIYAD